MDSRAAGSKKVGLGETRRGQGLAEPNEGQHTSFLFFLSCSWVSVVWGRKGLLNVWFFRFCASPATHSCQAYWALVSFPNQELGNQDSGNVHLRSPSAPGTWPLGS